MLLPDSQDDVVELCRFVDMDPTGYKRFALPITSATTPKPLADPAVVVEQAAPTNSQAADRPSPTTEEIEPVEHGPSMPHDNPTANPPIGMQHFHIGQQLAALAKVHTRVTSKPAVLQLISSVGGCGVTTVLATLGRALSILGERVLLVDSQSSNELEWSYGATTQDVGLTLSTEAQSGFEGQVHVLRIQNDARSTVQTGSTRFLRASAQLKGRIDRVLVAGTESFRPVPRQPQEWGQGICLVVVTPELRTLLAVPSILRAISGDVDAHFVLNRFNENIAAHREMRTRLEKQLGSQLLPFSIPESVEVQEALIKGVSVLDITPQSPLADTFFELAEWYRSKTAIDTALPCHFEETQLAISE